MNAQGEKAIKPKLGLLELAKQLVGVSQRQIMAKGGTLSTRTRSPMRTEEKPRSTTSPVRSRCRRTG